MSATAAAPRARAGSAAPAALTISPAVAFAAVALLSALRFSHLLAHPPLARTLGIVAVGVAVAVALPLVGARAAMPWAANGLRAAVVLLGLYVAFRLAGATAKMLWPWHWGRLGHELGRGFRGFDGLWPYDGGAVPAGVVVMLGVAAGVVGAAAIAFWPAGDPELQACVALVVLLVLYATGAVNEPESGWQVQGLLAAAAAWLWVFAWWRSPDVALGGRAGAWIAAASLVGVLAAGVLESSTPLVNFHAWNPFSGEVPGVQFNWNQEYGPLDPQHSGEVMFSASAPAPYRWRVTTLDDFDGYSFQQSGDLGSGQGLAHGPERGSYVRARFTIQGLRSSELLTPGIVSNAVLSGATLPRPQPLTGDGTFAVQGNPPTAGDSYTVNAFVASSSPAVLRRAPHTIGAAPATDTWFALPGQDTPITPSAAARPAISSAQVHQIDASPYAGVYALAQRLAAGAPTNYDVAERIEHFLADGAYTYSLTPPHGTYPLVTFLLDSSIGYCQQFSGAMALLLRMDGIPARVVAGFTPGARQRNGTYTVTVADAHDWVEVYFTGVGWVTFDPTPPSAAAAGLVPGITATAATGRSTILQGVPKSSLVKPRGGFNGGRGAAASRRGPDTALRVFLGVVGVLVLGLLAALAVWLVAARRRWTAAAARPDGEGQLELAMSELAAALSVLGHELPPGTTLTAVELGLSRTHGYEASNYAALLCSRRYGRSADARRPSAADRRAVRRALGEGTSPWTRLRLLGAIPPGVGAPGRG